MKHHPNLFGDDNWKSRSSLPSLREIARALGGEVSGDNVLAPGPGHQFPKDRSLSVKLGDDDIVVNSFAGDDPTVCKDYVRSKCGMPEWKPGCNGVNGHHTKKRAQPKADREPEAEKPDAAPKRPRPKVIATYVYQQADGTPYLRVERTDQVNPKLFWQSHWTGNDWATGKPKGSKIPYRLPEFAQRSAEPVYITEGEKDADRLAGLGLLATTSSDGAGKWTSELNQHFRGRHVFILPDNDDAGRKHAAQVASNLYGVTETVTVVDLPGLPPKGDVSDWLDAGGTVEKLATLAADAPRVKDEPVPDAPMKASPKLHTPVLSLADWLGRDLPPTDPLLGHWLTTTSRVLLAAPTGVGKSMAGIALGMRVAAGMPFLGWAGRRPCKALVIDGEMSARLFKERMAAEQERLGVIPAGFHALSHEDIEGFAPLNTPEGQNLVEAVIAKIGKVELVIFDNIMSLLSGNMKETEPWAATMPWARSLTRRGIGQIWIHHTNDNNRVYGDKTIEWQMDTLLLGERIERSDTDVSIKLKFAKARERTPPTRADFADVHVALVRDAWTHVHPASSAKRKECPSPTGRKYLDALLNALAGDDVTTLAGRRCVSLEAWKRECAAIGLIDQNDPKKAGSLFSKYKIELISRHQVASNEAVAWVL